MKRNRDYSMQKRTTFLKLFLKAVCVSLICTAIFAGIFREILSSKIHNDIIQSMLDSERTITSYIMHNQADGIETNCLSGYMSMYTYYSVLFDDLPEFMYHNPDQYQIYSDFGNPDNFALSAIVDSNGNTIATNRAKFTAILNYGRDSNDSGLYECDPQMVQFPEVQKLYDDCFEMLGMQGSDYYSWVSLDIESAYVDKSTRCFIPHEADMKLETDIHGDFAVRQTKHISINLNDDRFELVTLCRNEISEHSEDIRYPYCALSCLYGSSWEIFDNHIEKVNDYGDDNIIYGPGSSGDWKEYECDMQTLVYVNGEQCKLNMYYHSAAEGTIAETIYHLGIAAFGVISVLLALLWAWQKNVRNKARYAFEDYQRDLTDNLAHDMKTPLMAISGYAENVLNGKLTEAEQTEYLNSILDNVSFTDSLISRTLYLNHMDGHNMSPETIQLMDLAEEILGKYALLLQDKKIVYSVSGNADVHADRNAMETVIENLISNAVKYTPNGGTFSIAIDKKRMAIINSVSERLDTKELKRPFVRGDAARSNADGNGLGLSIAERAALANGFRLTISCSDTAFRAEVIF